MPKLYKRGNTYVLNGLQTKMSDSLLLDSGESLEVDVNIVDKRHITQNQRKFIFLLCKDLSDYTGENKELIRATVQKSYEDTKKICHTSLMDYSETEASELIDCIIEFGIRIGCPNVARCLENGYTFSEKQTYSMILSRTCCICGRAGADIHHYDQIGTKGNREKISHIGLRVLPLCRYHHTLFHNIGKLEWDKKFHTTPCKVDEKIEWFIKKGVLKEFDEDIEDNN